MKIPTEWQPITPTPQELTLEEQRVKRLLDTGANRGTIACRLHIGYERLDDIVTSIRRKEAIAARFKEQEEKAMPGKRLTEEQRGQIREARAEGLTYRDIAEKVGASVGTVTNVLKADEMRAESGPAERAETPQESHREPESTEAAQPTAAPMDAAECAPEKAGETARRSRAKHDAVNHPQHYTAGGIECIDAIEAAVTGLTGAEAVCTAQAIKYIWRWKRKNGAEDIRKAIWYLHRLLKAIGEEDTE